MNSIYLPHLLFAFLLIIWCFMHSALISIYVLERARLILKNRFKFYRLFYNSFAIITLLPIAYMMLSMPRVTYFEWAGLYRVFQILLFGAGLFFLLAGAKQYDALQFLGIRQLSTKNHKIGLSETGGLNTNGILGVTRHPWYLGGILLLWARDLTSVSLIVNVIFTAYLLIGARLEEKKLLQEFGSAYADYQSRVSMLVPWKWMRASIIKRD